MYSTLYSNFCAYTASSFEFLYKEVYSPYTASCTRPRWLASSRGGPSRSKAARRSGDPHSPTIERRCSPVREKTCRRCLPASQTYSSSPPTGLQAAPSRARAARPQPSRTAAGCGRPCTPRRQLPALGDPSTAARPGASCRSSHPAGRHAPNKQGPRPGSNRSAASTAQATGKLRAS